MPEELQRITAERRGKAIVLFSDGTGNSSAKLQKTNVWRLYLSVDVRAPAEAGAGRQLAFYDNGVGTSGFKPLALLGGAFGVGLHRNVLDLYRFICRHYEPGDRIYAFGFSRGAFTVRVLVGFLCEIGLVRVHDENGREIVSEGELNLLAEDAYRRFRRCFQVTGFTKGLVTWVRNVRDAAIARSRKRKGLPMLMDSHLVGVRKNDIAFLGVWDTVAAYGAPVAEITRGIDRWIWPLSMPNYHLSSKVACARHALALDDERDTFHPLLWDEVHERKLVNSQDPNERVAPDRLQQVWFTGMHSDVGGGYSDDSLAHVSLVWMAREAQRAGLRLHREAMEGFERLADSLGPMHDSRAGLASYYRYQPRKISARLDPPDPLTRIVQDPDMNGRGLLMKVHVHASVLERIKTGIGGYAPIVLPPRYTVEDGPPFEHHAELRAGAQELVWDEVWKRRIGYFATLGATLVLVFLPFIPREPALSCNGPQCAIVPLLGVLEWLLPDFLAPWLNSFSAHPGVFLAFTAAIVGLLAWTRGVEVRLRDRMRRQFERSMSHRPEDSAELQAQARTHTRVRSVRVNGAYQSALRILKWRIGPVTAATVLSSLVLLLTATVLLLVLGSAHRVHMAAAEALGRYCRQDLLHAGPEFATNELCWRAADVVEKNKRYRVRLFVKDEPKWSDDGLIAATPEGLSSAQADWWFRYPAVMLRRSMSDPWFQPLVRIEGHRSMWGTATSLPMKRAAPDKPEYVGEFTAPATGPLVFSVNDAVLLWGGEQYFYRNNQGAATIKVELVQ
jgi:hypothetical protein